MKSLVKYLSIFLLLLTTSCVGDKSDFKNGYKKTLEETNDPDRRENLRDLTSGGETLPGFRKMKKVFGTVGNINRKGCGNDSRVELRPSKNKYSAFTSSSLSSSSYLNLKVVPNTSVSSALSYYKTSLKTHRGPRLGCIPTRNVSLAAAKKAIAAHGLRPQPASGRERNTVKSKGASDLELRALGAGLIRMMQLNGGQAVSMGGSLPVVFNDKKASSAYRSEKPHGRYVLISRKSRIGNVSHSHYHPADYGYSVAQHVHELAHVIGGQKGAYGKYRRALKGGDCNLSSYAATKKNEQFAETLTAFVTDPAILVKKAKSSQACARALSFFKTWFKTGSRVDECIKK